MIKTFDGCLVTEYDRVYEIMWYWVNYELSIAYPQWTQARRMPEGVRMWRNIHKCRRVCDKLNGKHAEKRVT
jgi:hypothetical protein